MGTASKAMSFVARIWLESGPNGHPRWRGHVKHVQTGRDGFFDDLPALRTFVEGVSGLSGSTLQPRRRRARRMSGAAKAPRKEVAVKAGRKRSV